MLEKIKELEALARSLEPTAEQKTQADALVNKYGSDFLSTISTNKAYVATGDKGLGIRQLNFQSDPRPLADLIALVQEHVDTPGLNPASGGHLGYIPGGGVYYSALADYMVDVTNRYSGVFYASPGAVRMENQVIEWMASVVDYPKTAVGNITSGGSIGNLIAIVSARESKQIKAANITSSPIYLTTQAHHSVNKSIRIAGLGECPIRFVPVDEHYRMKTQALRDMIEADKAAGLKPWLVVASSGTTDTGAMDPLYDIGMIAKEHNIWYHVDGAYGAFFSLVNKNINAGIELSDSVVMDPHKGLFLPYGCGAVIVKDPKAILEAHHYTANYLQDAISDQTEISPADVSPELTKHFRGLRIWLPLQHLGLKPFVACLEEKLELAKYFHSEISKIKGFVSGPQPDLSVVIYRFIPDNADANKFNEELQTRIIEDGRVFISSTTIDGIYWLRLAILSFRSHLDFVQLALNVLEELSTEMVHSKA